MDTLKISTTEKTADNVWAEGGYGNARLISWDYGKNINVNLTDALCTPASLGLCWGGVLGADWKDSHIKIESSACNRCEPVEKISRIEKGFYSRNDKENSYISNLLPHTSSDILDKTFNLLKISSVVDGTKIEGFGQVQEHSYKWRMAIESVVCSIAQVPDRFFDVKGRSYPIDINRKVSVHSLPTYENYKDAIIYKINTRTKGAPPLAKIIFDYAMESLGRMQVIDIEVENQTSSSMTLAQILKAAGYQVLTGGIIKENDLVTKYYYSFRPLSALIEGTLSGSTYTYTLNDFLVYEILDDEIISRIETTEIDYDAPTTSELVNYNQNHAMTDLIYALGLDQYGSIVEPTTSINICEADYLAIIVDNNNDYHAYLGVYALLDGRTPANAVIWNKPKVPINMNQFKGLDMWLRFSSINEMIYFLITKYEEDIISIDPSTINSNETPWSIDTGITTVEKREDQEAARLRGKLWAYVNPNTMQPYDDDYWFHQGDIYLVKSLTLAEDKKLKANKIVVKADTWPGMYMMVGETWIRNKIGQDERMQIKFPLCKVKSEHSLTLEADGDPQVFNLQLEVAKPANGNLMEITTYEVSTKMVEGENGCFYAVDGSTEILSE